MARRLLLFAIVFVWACSPNRPAPVPGPGELQPPGESTGELTGERHVVLLATNDLHGGIEPERSGSASIGGLALLGGAVRAIREGLQAREGDRAGVLLVDAGDQFQGTLISNYDEGQLVFAAMDRIGFDAVVPGNHDFDFGPIGWLEDRGGEPRGALERLAGQVRFPLLSANTYLKGSLVGPDGKPVSAQGVRCAVSPGTRIDWSRAERPAIFRTHVIREVAQVRVALIGLDSEFTPKTTTAENVEDLCFRDGAETYLELRAELEGKADVFVLIMHNGNSTTSFSASEVARKILNERPGSVHAIVAGHTHFINHTRIEGVPLIQSGSGGQMFGRIDLRIRMPERRVRTEEISSYAGVKLRSDRCSPSARPFCADGEGKVELEGVTLRPDAEIEALVARARESIAPLAGRRLGYADRKLDRDRAGVSPLANALTDAFRSLSGADIAMLNTAGLRDTIDEGEVTYESLFRVLPFANHGLVIGPLPAEKVLKTLERSIRSCGGYGAMMQSGLKVTFEKDCAREQRGADPKARLLRVETLAGETVFDAIQGVRPAPDRVFAVATLDFLADGGAGYKDLSGFPVLRDLGIFREALTDELLARPVNFSPAFDDRWKTVAPSAAGP